MRILLIEDSLRLQETLRAGFTHAGYAIDVVGDGERGLLFAKREHYDVIVLDLMLPGMDGLELLRRLRNGGSEAHVLILTAKHSTEDRVRGLRCGADDYVPKPFAFEELLARVEALVRRRYRTKGPEVRLGELSIDTAGRRVFLRDHEVVLTRREFRILDYLARRVGETVSRTEIEDHVYNESNLPESNSVESAVCAIRRKLNETSGSRVDLIRTRHGVGYCLELPSS